MQTGIILVVFSTVPNLSERNSELNYVQIQQIFWMQY